MSDSVKQLVSVIYSLQNDKSCHKTVLDSRPVSSLPARCFCLYSVYCSMRYTPYTITILLTTVRCARNMYECICIF